MAMVWEEYGCEQVGGVWRWSGRSMGVNTWVGYGNGLGEAWV